MSNPLNHYQLTQRTPFQRPAPVAVPDGLYARPEAPIPSTACTVSYENAAFYVAKIDSYVFQTAAMDRDALTVQGRESAAVAKACQTVQHKLITAYNDSNMTADSHYADQLAWMVNHYHTALRETHDQQRLPQPMLAYINNIAQMAGTLALANDTPKTVKRKKLAIFGTRTPQEQAAYDFGQTCDNIITRLYKNDDNYNNWPRATAN